VRGRVAPLLSTIVALPPEARDAIHLSEEIGIKDVQAVDLNGLDIYSSNPYQPALIVPMECSDFARNGWAELKPDTIADNPVLCLDRTANNYAERQHRPLQHR
jgi:hypothetical protein